MNDIVQIGDLVKWLGFQHTSTGFIEKVHGDLYVTIYVFNEDLRYSLAFTDYGSTWYKISAN